MFYHIVMLRDRQIITASISFLRTHLCVIDVHHRFLASVVDELIQLQSIHLSILKSRKGGKSCAALLKSGVSSK
ncbi:hypothetical protein F7734_40210 [Scytonema sp. UIC 10036]|uniref:hypothetical protein n=1 Tax=Scytonema sp. UIC 10036 TaxID=2304196 RepID=UPI0012DA058A|nr:hypothetical protein [Scytonema sp. UIC 10036]MUG98205.1 hypothetical protein [Scytonema sp. UIC 10036]